MRTTPYPLPTTLNPDPPQVLDEILNRREGLLQANLKP